MLLYESKDGTKVYGLDDNVQIKKNLIELYDFINEIACSLPQKITKKWFLTSKQVERMKKDNSCLFI